MIEEIKSIYQKIGFLEKGLISFVIIGSLVVVVSLFKGIVVGRQVQIEHISGSELGTKVKIGVDVEGAVVKTGFYELPEGSRVKDALVAAGGMSEKADRDYAQKSINLAETLKDGQKIYLPFLDDTPSMPGYVVPNSGTKLINLNTATTAELDTLWGIGEARIENVVKNRPYKSLEELVAKKVFTKQILEKNKDKITVF